MKERNLPHEDHWATPDDFYNNLNLQYDFDFDPCPFMHDINKWDGLKIEWKERNYINPPYSDKKATGYLKTSFVKKALEESKKGKLCVLLLPVSTSTKLFHNIIKPNADSIELLKGRLKFKGVNTKGQFVNYPNPTDDFIKQEGTWKLIPLYIKNSGMHDSMLVVFDGRITFNYETNKETKF